MYEIIKPGLDQLLNEKEYLLHFRAANNKPLLLCALKINE
jgi:hypothetical protein